MFISKVAWELKGESEFFLGVKWSYGQRNLKKEHFTLPGKVSRTK